MDILIATRESKTLESPICSSPSSPLSPPLTDHLSFKEKWVTFPKAAEKPLLPGIPNEITFAHIVPKLTWRDFYILSAVSLAWCHAIRSHHVYDARVGSRSMEMLILFSYWVASTGSTWIALYSRTDNACYKLPSIPNLDGGIRSRFKCVALNGKIYLVGVPFKYASRVIASSYVFDLAGQKQWQKCQGIEQFKDGSEVECGVLDGKIYAFWRYGSRVFDPVANTCSVIKKMPSLRFDYRVGAMGDQLFVYGGTGDDDIISSDSDDDEDHDILCPHLDVYHPDRDEWTVVDEFRRHPRPELMGEDEKEVLFMAQGKFHSMSQAGIHVYDADQNSWTYLHSFSWACLGPVFASLEIIPCAVVAVDDELFAIVDFSDILGTEEMWPPFFLRSGGLGSENKELEWENVEIPSSFRIRPQDMLDIFVSPLQL